MKQKSPGKVLPFLTLGAAIVALFLQVWYYAKAMDAKNLLRTSHPAGILLWAVTGAYLIAAVAVSRRCAKKCDYIKTFPVTVVSTLGCLIAALGALAVDVWLPLTQQSANTLGLAAGALEAFAFLMLALLSGGRKNVQAGLYCLLSVAFMLRLISQYKQWSYLPQILTYCFSLLASVCMMITAFHRATLAYEGTGYRRYRFFSQAAVFFACLCLTGDGLGAYIFHLTMSVWLLTDYFRGAHRR